MSLCEWITTICAILVEMMSGAWAMPPSPDNSSLPPPQTSVALAQPTPGLPRARPQATAARLPLAFVANQGQTAPQVQFLAHGRDYTLFLTPAEAVLAVWGPRGDRDPTRLTGELGQAPEPQAERDRPPTVLRMTLVGANPEPQIVGMEELPGKAHDFRGNDPQHWRTNLPTYAKVTYQGIYPGVDLVYHGTHRHLEYDFVVAPGADPQAIRLAFVGAEKLDVDARGDLVLVSGDQTLRLRQPRIYQEGEGGRQEVAGGYVLLPAGERHTLAPRPPGEGPEQGRDVASLGPQHFPSPVMGEGAGGGEGPPQVGFQLAAYDGSKAVVIDPVLEVGGSGNEPSATLALDTAGNIYLAGTTLSADFPTTAGAFQSNLRGIPDVVVLKLAPDGSTLVYSTYLGGNSTDQSPAIAVDGSGNAYVTGSTESADFPTTPGAFRTTGPGPGLVSSFVTKLNAAGSALVYSTYLEGVSRGIAVDGGGNAYLTGLALAGFPFPTTPGAFQTTALGGGDAYVAKLNATGTALVYATHLGGSSAGFNEQGFAIAVDAQGFAYVTGQTDSRDFPLQNPIQGTFGGGTLDAFVVKVNETGTALVYGTYLGGSGLGSFPDDSGDGIAVDASGAAYVVGTTISPDFPTQRALQGTIGGGFDAFIAKVNAAGSALVYSTYLGGSRDDLGSGIAVDGSGRASVTGRTFSPNFPLQNPLQDTFGGGPGDAFVAQLAADGTTLDFSSYFGGSGFDFGTAIAVTGNGTLTVAGVSDSTDLPAEDSEQLGPRGGTDIFTVIMEPLQAPPGPKAGADLAVKKTLTRPSRPKVGATLVYTVTVTNNGPDEAERVILEDLFFGTPEGITLLSVEPSELCQQEPFGGRCELDSLAVGEIFEVTIKVRVLAPEELRNEASASSDTLDPDPSNNTAEVTTKVRRKKK